MHYSRTSDGYRSTDDTIYQHVFPRREYHLQSAVGGVTILTYNENMRMARDFRVLCLTFVDDIVSLFSTTTNLIKCPCTLIQ